MQMAQI